jgi:hypothetical protein
LEVTVRTTLLLIFAGGLACATAPTSSKLSSGRSNAIKDRAANAQSGLQKRRSGSTAAQRRKELGKRPAALDTLRPRKERPKAMPAPAAKKAKPRQKPAWVVNAPSSDGTWIYGYGSANANAADGRVGSEAMGESSLAWNTARDRAYSEVASQLKVRVIATAKDFQGRYQIDGKVTEVSHFSEAISSHVDTSLEGVELHDRWAEKGRVHVLARFDKAAFDARMAERWAALRAELEARVGEAEAALAKGDRLAALAAALRAAVAQRNLFDVPVQVGDRLATVVIERLVRDASQGMTVQASAATTGRSGQPVAGISVTLRDSGIGLNGAPIRFALRRGAGLDPVVVDTQDGIARLAAPTLWGTQASLAAELALDVLAGVARGDHAWLRGRYGASLRGLRGGMSIRLEPLPVAVKGQFPQALLEGLSGHLGLRVSSSAEWVVSGGLDDMGCKDLSMRRSCKVGGSVTLREVGGARREVSLTLTRRGTHSDDARARAQAERRLIKRLAKGLAERLAQ